MAHAELCVAGWRLHLRPDGSVFAPAQHGVCPTLWVADLHLGKAHQYRALGMPVGERVREGSDADTLARLTQALRDTQAECLVVLGDLVHGAHTGPALAQWWARLCQLEPGQALQQVVLVCGNHDRRALQALTAVQATAEPVSWRWVPEADTWRMGALAGRHAPPEPHELAPLLSDTANGDATPAPAVLCLAGHWHPCLPLRGPGRDALRLPCFWLRQGLSVGPSVLVLPAFGSFTGKHPVQTAPGDALWVLTPGQVMAVPGPA